MQLLNPVRFALISVFDKKNILEFAQSLHKRGVKIISTDGTANILLQAGLPIIQLSNYTKLPNMIHNRIKTLHHKIYGGILGRFKIDDDIMQKYDMQYINIIVVNFYSFNAIKNKSLPHQELIENIDIGGPSMVRAAAKNYQYVTVVVNISDYSLIINEMDNYNGAITLKTSLNLATKAFEYVSTYDKYITDYFRDQLLLNCHHNKEFNLFPNKINFSFIKRNNMLYGENNHQLAAFYSELNNKELSIMHSKQLQGKSLSYNNIVDADVALECVKNFIDPTCVIVKHANPCGIATSNNILSAYKNAYYADPISAFGGIIAFNRLLDINTIKTILKLQFVEIIIAPCINDDALSFLSNKKNIRVLILNYVKESVPKIDIKSIYGGILIQEHDCSKLDYKDLNIVTKRYPTKKHIQDAIFCWKVAKFVKSNAIVYARDQKTIGIGAGQTSRIHAVKIALIKANDSGLNIQGSVMASDAFISFCDVIEISAQAGIDCIIQPGGSIHDNKLISIANKYNLIMIFTNIRNFRH